MKASMASSPSGVNAKPHVQYARPTTRMIRAQREGPDKASASRSAMSAMRRGCEDGEDEQPAAAGIPDAVRHAFRRDEQIAGLHRQLAIGKQEHAFTVDHVIDLVLPGVRMQRMRLARFECIETHEQSRRFENR